MTADSGGSIKPVAVIILGADMLVAASPATPIQLWHACLASGYDLAVPATWGDELVAAECLRALGSHPETVAVMCSCPMVARAIGDGEADLSAHLVSLVAPPVATARYLRRVYGERRVHITFAGACPAAGDSAIDAWLTPPELLGRFLTTGVELERQPQLFESVLPPDRRRHLSQPGGVPTVERAAALARPRQLIVLDDADLMTSIRRHLMGGVRALVDVAPRLGCSCSGAVERQPAAEAREAVTRLEPPRSMRPVMPDPGGLGLLRRVSPRSSPRDAGRTDDRTAPPAGVGADGPGTARPVATSRPASRSPLSWNLRERALPQPPTTGRSPGTSSHRGPAAGAWSTLDTSGPGMPGGRGAHPSTSTSGSAESVSLDPATVAAVRALEASAKGRQAAEPPPASAEPPRSDPPRSARPAGERDDAIPPSTPATPASQAPVSAARSSEAPVVHQREGETASTASRPTPPGGYWFVPVPAAEQPDVEVSRGPPNIERGSTAHGDGEPKDAAGSGVASPETDNPEPILSRGDDEPSAPTPGTPDSDAADVTVIPPGDAHRGEAGGDDEVPRASPDGPAPPPSEEQRGNQPPDRGWIIATTIVLLVASALAARGIVHRRIAEPVVASASFSGRATADVVLVVGSGVGPRGSAMVESVFVAGQVLTVPPATGPGLTTP